MKKREREGEREREREKERGKREKERGKREKERQTDRQRDGETEKRVKEVFFARDFAHLQSLKRFAHVYTNYVIVKFFVRHPGDKEDGSLPHKFFFLFFF